MFTHFDEVNGDNLPNAAARRSTFSLLPKTSSHQLEELGPFAEQALRGRLKDACFFVGGIDEDLDAAKRPRSGPLVSCRHCWPPLMSSWKSRRQSSRNRYTTV